MRGLLTFALVALVAARAVAQPQPQRRPAPPAQPAPVPSLGPAEAPQQPPPPPPSIPPPPDGSTDPDAPLAPITPSPDDTGTPQPDGLGQDAPLHEDNEFGPVVQIERIDIVGNTATRNEILLRALPIATGDVLHSSDRRLRDARFKLLALGFFRDVNLVVHKGSQRGQVVIEVRVVERGTLVLNRLWFGTTSLSPWWLGLDVGERNLSGLGIGVGGGFVYARHGDLPGARDQYAAEVRLTDPSVRGTRWGASWAATFVHGSEPFRTPCADASQCAFPYRRFGARIGATYNVSALTRLSIGLRGEQIDAILPPAPTAQAADGTPVAVDLHLDPGSSRVITTSVAIDHDTRPDPILPHAGSLAEASVELGSSLLGGSYDFATIIGRYDRYWPLFGDHQAFAIKLAGGVIVGDAPRFDRIYIADVDHMLTPRALGLVLSTAAPLAILNTGAAVPTYGDLGGSATAEYAFQLFRGTGSSRVFGADLYLGTGLWGLANRDALRARDTSLYKALPIDIYVDAGLRVDTDIGVFELAIANALGRLR